MKILVTGAGGFIGANLVNQLLINNYDVNAFFRYTSSGNKGNLSEYGFEMWQENDFGTYFGDIRSLSDIKRAMEGCDRVVHLAAQIAIPWSYKSPFEFMEVNVKGSMNVFQAARDLGVKRVVHMSTSEVYGTCQTGKPMDENHPQVAQSPYAASKIAADKFAKSFYLSYGTPIVIARSFNTFGPYQSNRAVIPSIILQALDKNEIELGSVNCRRDFNYVDDTASALMKICLSDKGNGEEYNLCSGIDYSIGDIVEIVADELGKELTMKIDKQRVRPVGSEVDILIGNGEKANKEFGLGGRTPFRYGIQQTIEYFREHFKPERFTL